MDSLVLKIRMPHTITRDAVTFHGTANAHAELDAELRRIDRILIERGEVVKGGLIRVRVCSM